MEQNKDANDTNPFRYCGEYFDDETESVYLRARYYSPVLGRFITEDPIRDGLNWYTYCGANPILFVDIFGLEKVRVSMEGITYHKLDNVEDKTSGTYASIRSIARHNNATVDFRLDEDGVGATVNYTIVDHSIGGTYGHRIEIRFNNFKEREFASGVRILAFGDNGEFEVTGWTSDSVVQKLNTQEAYFYVKKDENSDNLVVQAKVSTMYYCSGNKRMLKYMLGMWNLSGIISERENIDRQMVLDKLYESQPLLMFDPSEFVDIPSSNYEAYVETAMDSWRRIRGY